jgi:branched-chain amino acid transport system permease protein
LLENFAAEILSRERFNLVIGMAFMLIVSISRDGLLGILSDAARLLKKRPLSAAPQATLEKVPR